MAVNNSLAKASQNRLGIGTYLTGDAVKNRINQVVGGKDGQRFISAVVSAVQNNNMLQECSNQSILSAALLGESLKLSPSPQLGQYYMVPFKVKVKDPITGKQEEQKQAQFQLGYKGYIQLAIRSGQYKKLNVLAIKEGELVKYDPLNEEIEVHLIDDEEAREAAETVGYYAMFEYTNGFRKTLYWSKKKMMAHAAKYSQGYKNDLKYNTAYTFWSKDFDGMAYKTMLRQLISKWGIMSIDMQMAMEADQAIVNEDGSKTYVDNDPALDAIPVVEANQADEVDEVKAEPVKEAPAKKAEKKNVEPEDDIQALFFQ